MRIHYVIVLLTHFFVKTVQTKPRRKNDSVSRGKRVRSIPRQESTSSINDSFRLLNDNKKRRKAIVNGRDVTNGDRYGYFTFIAIFLGSGEFYACGGTLIHPEWVLTSAHCFEGEGDTFSVYVGYHSSDEDKDEDIRSGTFSDVYMHPLFDEENWDFDAALIHLDRPSLSAQVKLDDGDLVDCSIKEGDELTIMGFGVTESNLTDIELPDVLQETRVQYKSSADCVDIYKAEYFTDNNICTSGEDTGFCLADDGGPLISPGANNDPEEDIQIGILSWYNDCVSSKFPSVYTKIRTVRPWIHDTICEYSLDALGWCDVVDLTCPAPTISPSPSPPILTNTEDTDEGGVPTAPTIPSVAIVASPASSPIVSAAKVPTRTSNKVSLSGPTNNSINSPESRTDMRTMAPTRKIAKIAKKDHVVTKLKDLKNKVEGKIKVGKTDKSNKVKGSGKESMERR